MTQTQNSAKFLETPPPPPPPRRSKPDFPHQGSCSETRPCFPTTHRRAVLAGVWATGLPPEQVYTPPYRTDLRPRGLVRGGGGGLEERTGGGGVGLGPKSLCTKIGPARFSQRQTSFFPTMVTLVGGGGACAYRYGMQGCWCAGRGAGSYAALLCRTLQQPSQPCLWFQTHFPKERF